MKILAIEKEILGVTQEQCKPYLTAEAARVWTLYQAGIIREIYFLQNRAVAVLIMECTDIQEANKAIYSLPLVQEGLISFEIMPLKPYPGFFRLFNREE